MGIMPFEHLEEDFTDIQPNKGYWYLLATFRTFSGWVEAFPPVTEKAQEASPALVREIIPNFVVLTRIRSDNSQPSSAKLFNKCLKQWD